VTFLCFLITWLGRCWIKYVYTIVKTKDRSGVLKKIEVSTTTLAAYRTPRKNGWFFGHRGPKNRYFAKMFFLGERDSNFTHFEYQDLYDQISSSGRKWQKKDFSRVFDAIFVGFQSKFLKCVLTVCKEFYVLLIFGVSDWSK